MCDENVYQLLYNTFFIIIWAMTTTVFAFLIFEINKSVLYGENIIYFLHIQLYYNDTFKRREKKIKINGENNIYGNYRTNPYH